MEFDGQLPDEVPVMTLSSVVLFPQAVLPLHIFESRYRQMLRDVMAGPRVFAIVQEADEASGEEEPMHLIGTVGLVRACYQQPDGTSNLVLHGLSRVRIANIVREAPYRVVRIEPVETCYDVPAELARRQQFQAIDLIRREPSLQAEAPEGFFDCLASLDDPAVFADLAAATFCLDPERRQRILEALEVGSRYELLLHYLQHECGKRSLHRLLQGRTTDEEIERN